MIRVDSSCFCPREQSENNNDGFQSTISFGGILQPNIQERSNQSIGHFSYQNKATLKEIFNCYLKNPQLEYTLNCLSAQYNSLQQSSNEIYSNGQISQFQSQNPIISLPLISQQNLKKPKTNNLIKFSQIVKNIQAIKSPKNAQKLTFKSNLHTVNQAQNLIKIEDRQNVDPNLIQTSKQKQKINQKSCSEEFLKLQSKVQFTDKQNQTKLKRKKSIKNLRLSRKQKLLSPFKTINPQNKNSNLKNIHSNSIFKDNQSVNKMTISGLEFSKKYKKKALKNKTKVMEINSNKNLQQAQFLR